MSIARALARILRTNFQMHVAWVPVATRFSLGDYGLWRDGVFAPLGNISEFGIEPSIERGREITLEFISSRGSATDIDAKVGIPRPAVGAVTRLHFSASESFLIKVGKLASTRIANIAEVARQLDATGRWRWQQKIVGELFVGEDVLLVATSERDTTVSLRGAGNVAISGQGLQLGAGVTASADKQLGLNITGGAGPVGLGLFRVRISGAPALNFSVAAADSPADSPADPSAPAIFISRDGELAEIAAEDEWDGAPEDDPVPAD